MRRIILEEVDHDLLPFHKDGVVYFVLHYYDNVQISLQSKNDTTARGTANLGDLGAKLPKSVLKYTTLRYV